MLVFTLITDAFQVEYVLWVAHTSSSPVKVGGADENDFSIFLLYPRKRVVEIRNLQACAVSCSLLLTSGSSDSCRAAVELKIQRDVLRTAHSIVIYSGFHLSYPD